MDNIIIYFLCLSFWTVIGDKIRLYKISKYNDSIINSKIFVENREAETIKKGINLEKIDLLLPFLEKLEGYTDISNLKAAYSNLSDVNVKRMNLFDSLIFSASGIYSTSKNEISYSKLSLGHEFLHMCSSYFNKETKEENVGFLQQKALVIIGKGLNEGYTDLLSKRIYDSKISYIDEANIAQLFELFFENPKDMERFYFNHDLPGFIHYMEKFALKKDIIDVILKLDSASFISSTPSLLPSFFKFIEIRLKLYEWYSSNIKDEAKLQKFKDLMCENKITSLLLNGGIIKLYKDKHYDIKSDLPILDNDKKR